MDDEELIRRAESIRTGANSHAIGRAVGWLKIAIAEKPSDLERARDNLLKVLKQEAAKLA